MPSMSNANTRSHGFTLIEMLVIAPIVILVIGAFISMMVAMTGEVIATRAQNVMAYDTQNALNQIEQDVKQSSTFLATNDFTLQSPQDKNATGTTISFKNVTSGYPPMLILKSFTTDKNPDDPARSLVYTNQPTASCDSAVIASNQLFYQEVVYFVMNNTLWRRTLIQQGASTPTLCATPWQLPSCSPGVTRGSYCKVDDQQLIQNVDSLTVQYFPNPSSTTADTAASDSTASDSARGTALSDDTTVNLVLATKQTAAGRTITYSGTLKATKLNTLPTSGS